mgnify:CR=1 FL=1
MADTNLDLLVDWNNDGDFADTGEDITSRTLSVEWQYGRDYASQLMGKSVGGKLKALLNNESGDYNSFNTSSPLSGNIRPGRKVQLRAFGLFPYDFTFSFSKPVWTGFLDRITPQPRVNGVNTASLEAVGPLGYLNQKEVQVDQTTDVLTGAAIGNILDAAGWPSGDRDLDDGQSTIARHWVDRQKTLVALRGVEEVEGGFIAEKPDGSIAFQDRQFRLKDPQTVSQATFTDADGAALGYSFIEQLDPLPFIFNEFEAEVKTFTVGSLAVMWTLSETGANSPFLAPGQTRLFIARHPNPDSATKNVGVALWTSPASTTDYTANAASDGSGTDLTSSMGVTQVKKSNAMEITVVNNGTIPAYLTKLQGRGLPIESDDPVRHVASDASSQTEFGQRTFQNRIAFSDIDEANDWAEYNLSIYKDPIPIMEITFAASRDATHHEQAMGRDVSDRITLVANRSGGTELGINADFFIESIRHVVSQSHAHWITWRLSPATGYSNFWLLGTSKLDSETALAY